METNNGAIKDWFRELFRVFCDGDPQRSLCARASDCFGTERTVCAVHFSDSSIDAGCRLENVASQPVSTWSFIHEPGGRLGCWCCLHYSMAQSPILVGYSHHISEFAGCAGLRVDGSCPAER